MSPKRIVCNEKERFAAWALREIGYPDAWGEHFEAIGVESDGPETDGWSGHGRILAAAVFTDYVPRVSITMHIAGRGLWCSRALAQRLFHFAFEECGVQRITAYTAARNARCQRLLERFGFQLDGVMPCALPNREAALVYGLLDTAVRIH